MALPFAVEFSPHHCDSMYALVCGCLVPVNLLPGRKRHREPPSHPLVPSPSPTDVAQIAVLVTTVPSLLVSSWALKVPGTPSPLWVGGTILLSLVPAHS